VNDELLPEKHYFIHLLNEDLQKQDEAKFAAKNIRISPAGVLEADRVWSNEKFTIKIFYKGEFFLTQMRDEEVEFFYDPESHDHGDEDE